MASETDGLALSESVNSAFVLAATECRAGQPLQTGRLLAALERVDGLGDWSRIWLHTGTPSALGLADVLDNAGDQLTTRRESWRGIPTSPALAAALRTLVVVAERYSLIPVPPGALALALVSDPDAGSTRALLEAGDISHDQLLDIIQADLLGTSLEGLGGVLASSGAPNEGQPKPVPSAGPFAALSPAPSRGPVPWSPAVDLPELSTALRTKLAGGDCLRRPKIGIDPCVVAAGDSVYKIYNLESLEAEDQRRVRARADFGRSLSGLEGVVPTVEVTEAGSALIVEMPRMGQSLEAHIEGCSTGGQPSLAAESYAEAFVRVADTLEGLHQRGLVHGNIKPSNLLVDPASGWLSISDVADAHTLNRAPAVRTVRRPSLDRYTAPERYEGEFGRAVDQFALGRTAQDVFRMKGAPPLTTPVHMVLQRAMAPRPGDRYPSVNAFGVALRDAVRSEAPRSLAERVTRWPLAIRARLEPMGLALAAGVVFAFVNTMQSITTPMLAELQALIIIVLLPLMTWVAVVIAAALGRIRPFPSLAFLNRRFVALAVLVAVIGGLFVASPGHSDPSVNSLWALIGVYAARAFLASPSDEAGSGIARALRWWDRRRLAGVPRWILSTMGLTVAAGVLVAPYVITTVTPRDWPKLHVSEFAPLATVWNFRSGLGTDDSAYICKNLVALPSSSERASCEPLMHAAAAVQSVDPIVRGTGPAAGEKGTWEAFLAQEIPAAADQRMWRLLASDAPDTVIGFMYTEPSGQVEVMLWRDEAKSNPSSGVSSWLYTLENRGDSWRIVAFSACDVDGVGTGVAPAKCVIRDSMPADIVAKINAAAKKG